MLKLLCVGLVGSWSLLCAEPLMISLGAWCHTGMALKNTGLKGATYPFDWLSFPDHASLIQILDDDFRFMTDENCFEQTDCYPHSPNTLRNTIYNILFHHDTPQPYSLDNKEAYKEHLKVIQAKYGRRIARFRALEGRVFFIRNPHWENNNDQGQNPIQAEELQAALRRYFPALNFRLVIVNSSSQTVAPIPPTTGILEFRGDNIELLLFQLSVEKIEISSYPSPL
jgi:hypothetical protein